MVDKATARLLVYGALGTLALILLVAVYALATKGTVQNELEKRLQQLREKEQAFKDMGLKRQEALEKFSQAQQKLAEEAQAKIAVEEQRDHYKDRLTSESHEKKSYSEESERLRRKLWDKDDQAELEKLEQLTEDQLMKELEQEGEEYFNNQKELDQEHLDEKEDQKDLDNEKEVAKNFQHQFEDVKKKLHDKSNNDEEDEGALESLEQFGEQSEVYLDELARDAKKNKKWKEGKRPGQMEELAKKIDLHAEALRNKINEKKLVQEDKDLDHIEEEAEQDIRQGDRELAPVVNDMAKAIEADEERLLREMGSADEDEELEAAEMMEKDAEDDEVKLAHLKEVTDEGNLKPEEKKERKKLIEDLEKELDGVEKEAAHVEKGLQRRHVRKDAIKMSKAVNRLSSQNLQKLKHGREAISDVENLLISESDLVARMREGNVTGEEEAGRKVAQLSETLEEDAEHLYDEAGSGDFDDLDEKLLDEQLAKELETAGEEMEHDADDVEEEDHERDLREAGAGVEANAENIGEKEVKQLGKALGVKKLAHSVQQDAKELARAIGEKDFKHEKEIAQRAVTDEEALEKELSDMEKEVQGAPDSELDSEDKKDDFGAIRGMREQGAILKREAQNVKKVVGEQAQHLKQQAARKEHEADEVLQN